MPDIASGETIEMQGSGRTPYVIKNVGGVYSCTCPAWRNQSLQPHQRTCKHIIKLRGQEAETFRLGEAMVNAPPVRTAEEKERDTPGVLLADSWDGEQDLSGWWMSEKLDGARAYWDGKRFVSRQGNVFLAPDWFLHQMPEVPLDGELWIGRRAFTQTMSVIRRQDKPDDWRRVKYLIFDAPTRPGGFEDRIGFVDDLLRGRGLTQVEAVAHALCRGAAHLFDELDKVEEQGGEGLMLRQPRSAYVSGRSATLLKVKRFHDAEARVVGHSPGEGRHEGRCGALMCEAMANGAKFSIGTGLSDADRNNPPAVGTLVKFRYQELSEYGVPRFPSYLGLATHGGSTNMPKKPALGKTVTPAVAVPAAGTTPVVTKLVYSTPDRTVVWEATRTGNRLNLKFGPAGDMKAKVMVFGEESTAEAELADMIAEKKDDGFVDATAVVAPAAAPVKAAPSPKPAPAPKAEPAPAPAAQPTSAGGKRRFEFVEGSSSKFWEVWTEGATLYTCYGRIGSKGSTTLKDGGSDAGAAKMMAKLIAEKTGKGYQEVEG